MESYGTWPSMAARSAWLGVVHSGSSHSDGGQPLGRVSPGVVLLGYRLDAEYERVDHLPQEGQLLAG